MVWFVSKSKKIIDVLSFVRCALASLNKTFAIFSADEYTSTTSFSLVLAVHKQTNKQDSGYNTWDDFNLRLELM